MRPTLINTVLFAAVASSLGAQELRLEDAIQLAIEHNRDVANAQLDLAISSEQMRAYHTTLFPSTRFYALGAQQLRPVDYTIRRGELGTFASTGPLPSNDVKFSTPLRPTGLLTAKVSQPLSGLYKNRLTLRNLDLAKQLYQEKLRGTRQDAVREVKRIYYQIQQKESSLEVTRETVALYKELERIANDSVLKQVALEPEQWEAQTRLIRAEEDLLTLGDQEANLKEQLNQLLGRDVLIEFRVTPVADTAAQLPIELAAARARALEHRPEIREAALKTRQAEQEVRIKHADYIPDVNAEFNAVSLLNFGSFLPAQTASVGVSLSWEPFDWGRKKHEMAQKRYSADQSRNQEADARSKVIIDVDSKYRQMRQVQAQFRVARLSQKTALEQVRISKKRHQMEAVLFKEVLNAQANLEQANNDYKQTLAQFLTALAEFEHAIGEDQ